LSRASDFLTHMETTNNQKYFAYRWFRHLHDLPGKSRAGASVRWQKNTNIYATTELSLLGLYS
jgi:hypothetical protein